VISPRGDIFTCSYGTNHIWFSDSATDGKSYINMTSPSFPLYTTANSFQWSSTGRMYIGLKGAPPNPGLYYTDDAYSANTTFTPVPNFYFNVNKMVWDDKGYLWVYGSGTLAQSDSVLTVPKKTTGVQKESTIPKEFALQQNYPNPFNPSTVINYQIPTNSHVTLKVYDVLGKAVATLVNETKEAGNYSVHFSASGGDATKLASGIYFYRLDAGRFSSIKKMTLLK